MHSEMLGHDMDQSMEDEEIHITSALRVQSKTKKCRCTPQDLLVHSDKSVWSNKELATASGSYRHVITSQQASFWIAFTTERNLNV